MSAEGINISGDPAVLKELFAEFNQWYRYYLESVATMTEKAMNFNQQVSSFHERLLLIALGTIGISLSAMISFAAKLSTDPSARKVFIHWVAPAWILLILSAVMSRNVMAFVLRINRALFTEWQKVVNNYHVNQIGLSLTKMSKHVTGALTVDSKPRPVAEIFEELSRNAQHTFDVAKAASLELVIRSDSKQLKYQGVISVWSMQIALVLLCVAAIRFFLVT